MNIKFNIFGYNIDFESIIIDIKSLGIPHKGNVLIKAGYFKKHNNVFYQELGLINRLSLKK